jgi:hypothetical protein
MYCLITGQKAMIWAGEVAQVVKLLPSKCEALSSNTSTTQKKKTKKTKKLNKPQNPRQQWCHLVMD